MGYVAQGVEEHVDADPQLTGHIPITSRMLGVELDGSRRICPAHVASIVGSDDL